MKVFKKVHQIWIKISAIAGKNLKMQLRYKQGLFLSYLSPLISIIMPIIILGKFFQFNVEFGPWNAQNYIIFILMGYIITLLRRIIDNVPHNLMLEKYWKTLPNLIIAPFNPYYLLGGILLSEVIIISVPMCIILIIAYIFVPISFFTFLALICVLLGISLIFTGISLIVGIFAVSNEGIMSILNFIIMLIFLAGCITYPFQIFPKSLQIFINLNPIYYIIDFVRLIWIEDDFLYTFSTHTTHLTIFIFFLLSSPVVGVFLYNYIFKKLGISGY